MIHNRSRRKDTAPKQDFAITGIQTWTHLLALQCWDTLLSKTEFHIWIIESSWDAYLLALSEWLCRNTNSVINAPRMKSYDELFQPIIFCWDWEDYPVRWTCVQMEWVGRDRPKSSVVAEGIWIMRGKAPLQNVMILSWVYLEKNSLLSVMKDDRHCLLRSYQCSPCNLTSCMGFIMTKKVGHSLAF